MPIVIFELGNYNVKYTNTSVYNAIIVILYRETES